MLDCLSGGIGSEAMQIDTLLIERLFRLFAEMMTSVCVR